MVEWAGNEPGLNLQFSPVVDLTRPTAKENVCKLFKEVVGHKTNNGRQDQQRKI
jgi:hypothetical protein